MITPLTASWAKLPIDIEAEIFSRLPESDLLFCKLVCKDWNFVISKVCIPILSPSGPSAPFIGFLFFEHRTNAARADAVAAELKPLKHVILRTGVIGESVFLRRSSKGCPIDGNILSLFRRRPVDGNVLSWLRLRKQTVVLDCCNGVLLIAAPSSSFHCRYYVGNPVTRERLAIPLNPNHHHNSSSSNVHSSLVLDPYHSFNFKIVRFTRSAVEAKPAHPIELDIFSWKTKRWSSHVLQVEPNSLLGFEWIRRAVYFNGSLYYISRAQYLVCIDDDILKLDGYEDDCSSAVRAWTIELPDKVDHGGHLGCIGNSSGNFCYSNRDDQGEFILVWMLVVGEGKKNSHWDLLHRIGIKHDIPPSYWMEVEEAKRLDKFRPIAFHPHKDQIFMASSRVLICYDIDAKEMWVSYMCGGKSDIYMDHNLFFPFFRCMLLIGQ